VLVTSDHAASGTAFGMVLAAGAAGAFLGTLVGSRIAQATGLRFTIAAAGALQGFTLVCAAVAPSILTLSIVWLVNGSELACSGRFPALFGSGSRRIGCSGESTSRRESSPAA